jgi:hypothetical protein
VDGTQPGIPGACAIFASAFQVIEEEANKGSIEVFDPDLGGHFAESLFWQTAKAGGSNRGIPRSYAGSLVVGEAGDR